MAITDKLAKTIEDTKSFVDTANEKMTKASKLLDEDVALVNQALKDYEEIKDMVEQAKTDLSAAIETLGEGVDAGADGDVLTLAATVVKGIAQVTDAMKRYTETFTKLKQKVENYKKAVEHNKQVIESF
jgi:methyl-accepting chemotaxis protein